MNELQAIEAITKDILAGYYGTRQTAGTETQKWQYAYNQARKIYEGELLIDPDHTWFDNDKYWWLFGHTGGGLPPPRTPGVQ